VRSDSRRGAALRQRYVQLRGHTHGCGLVFHGGDPSLDFDEPAQTTVARKQMPLDARRLSATGDPLDFGLMNVCSHLSTWWRMGRNRVVLFLSGGLP